MKQFPTKKNPRPAAAKKKSSTKQFAKSPRTKSSTYDLKLENEKLRSRLKQLEQTNAKQRQAEKKFHAHSQALSERMKELKCLYSVSSLLENHHADLGDILQRIVEVLPAAWQFPEQACARITLKSRKYVNKGFHELHRWQHAKIIIGNEQIGLVEVGYPSSTNSSGQPEFLPEEATLLNTIAERISEIVALKETQRKLQTYQEHLRSLASELTLAEERERRRLAISLHDRIGQSLAVAKLKLETLKHLLSDEHQERLRDLSALVKQIIEDTRVLTFEISPPILYELGFQQAIVWLGDHFKRQFNLPVQVHGSAETINLSEGVRVMLFRSVQELLANVIKHAQAHKAVIEIRRMDKEIRITVQDDGVGFHAENHNIYPSVAEGFGLFSIRERIDHLGGRVEIESQPGHGTKILIWAPLETP